MNRRAATGYDLLEESPTEEENGSPTPSPRSERNLWALMVELPEEWMLSAGRSERATDAAGEAGKKAEIRGLTGDCSLD